MKLCILPCVCYRNGQGSGSGSGCTVAVVVVVAVVVLLLLLKIMLLWLEFFCFFVFFFTSLLVAIIQPSQDLPGCTKTSQHGLLCYSQWHKEGIHDDHYGAKDITFYKALVTTMGMLLLPTIQLLVPTAPLPTALAPAS